MIDGDYWKTFFCCWVLGPVFKVSIHFTNKCIRKIITKLDKIMT